MKPLTIIVCIKTVPDPEGPASAFEIHSDTKTVVAVGIPPVINPYDENALEVAVRLKEQWGGKIIAVNVSEKAVAPVLKKALSVGADELILLEDPSFKDLTSSSIARILSATLRKIGSYDLILTGRQAADWDSGQVGLLLAGMLKIPSVNLAQAVDFKDEKLLVERLKRTGYEVVATSIPALITVSSEAGELRLATLKAIQETRKKPVTAWGAADLEIDAATLKVRSIRTLSRPSPRSAKCFFIDGKTAQEKGANLALRLRQDRVV